MALTKASRLVSDMIWPGVLINSSGMSGGLYDGVHNTSATLISNRHQQLTMITVYQCVKMTCFPSNSVEFSNILVLV